MWPETAPEAPVRSPLVLVVLLVASSAAAQQHKVSALLAAEGQADDDRPGHGIAMVAWDLSGLSGGAALGVELNTDTLRVRYDGLRLSDAVTVGAQLTGELFIAGLTTDYWQNGQMRLDRTFRSSYVQAQAWMKARVAARTYFEIEVGGRRWFFGSNDDTGAALELPPDAWVFEPRLRYTWWNAQDDAAWRDRHRFFPRVRGLALGVEIGVDARSDVQPWGARDPEAFDPIDPRNEPGQFALRTRQWLIAGWQAHPMLRLQVSEEAGAASGDDDVTRRRLGGLNPYVVRVPGVPWAHHLVDDYAQGHLGVHVKVAGDVEIGPTVAAAVLTDIDRVGELDDADVEWGVGLFADARFGAWQVDVRGGYSPSLSDRSDEAAWTAYVGVGWATE